MIRVKQKHHNSCVPACLATLAGIPYYKALKLVYPNRESDAWDDYGSSLTATLRALKKAKLNFKKRKKLPKSFKKLSCNAIIVIQHQAFGPPGEQTHAVVWDHRWQKILDPYVGMTGLKRHLPRSSYEKSTVLVIEVR